MTTVAITGLSANDSPAPGVAILRCLKESSLDLKLIGLCYDVLDSGNFMDLVSNSYLIPYPSAGPNELLDRIKFILQKEPIDILIPCLDSELSNYIELKDELSKLGIKTFLPSKEELHSRDKSVLGEKINNSEIEYPETFIVSDTNSLKTAIEKISYPCLIKGIFYEAYLAYNYEDAVAYFYRLGSKWGFPVLVQKYVKGEECNLAALVKDGSVVSSVMMKKLFLTDKGKAWAGVTILNEEVMRLSKEIFKKLNWNGGAELEFIIEQSTKKIYLLEMNPRFPAWIYLAKAAGLNLPEYLVKFLLENLFDTKEDYEIGKVFVRHSWDEIIPMQFIENLSIKGQREK